MSVKFKVVTTTEFSDMDSVEEFLKSNGAFQPWQVNELLEEKKLRIEVEDPNEQAIAPTITIFTLEEK